MTPGGIGGSNCTSCRLSAVCLPIGKRELERRFYKCRQCGAFALGIHDEYGRRRHDTGFSFAVLPACLSLRYCMTKEWSEDAYIGAHKCPACQARATIEVRRMMLEGGLNVK